VFGLFWGGWAVAAVDVERELDLSHGAFGLLLSVALLGGAAANAVGGSLAERRGTGRVLSGALVLWGGLLLVAAGAGQRAAFGVLTISIVAVGGLVDVVMNVAATAALAGQPGQLVRFHGLFNGGAAIGAGATGILLGLDHSWRWQWAVIGVAALVLAPVCRNSSLPASASGDRTPLTGALPLLRREGLVLVAVAFAVGAMVEGGIELWGVLFLRTHLPSGLLVGSTSAVVAYSVAAGARIVFGPAAGRRGAARGVTVGAGTAAAGILLLAAAPSAWLAGGGLVLAAGGISMCWPLLLAHASAGRARPGAIVGGVSAVGYTGFVAGPAIVGWLAAAAGLRVGLALIAVAAVFVAVTPALSHGRPALADDLP